MKKIVAGLLSAAILLTFVQASGAVAFAQEKPFPDAIALVVDSGRRSVGATYYVDSMGGNDANSGTNIKSPWKSLNKVTATTFSPGDSILLKSGSVWNGEWLWPKGSGYEGAPIRIDKYGGDEKPIVNGMGIDRGFNYSGAVHLRNQEYWEIRNLEVTNDDDFDVDIILQRPYGDNSWSGQNKTRNGILLIVDGDQFKPGDDGIMDHIYIEDCYVHDVDGPNDWNDTFTGGIIFNVIGTKVRPSTSYRDLRIAYNTIRKVDLLGITGFVQMLKNGYQDGIGPNDLWMRDVYIGHNYMEDLAQGAVDICDTMNAVVEYNVVDGFLHRYPNYRPTVALYPWKTENAVFQFNEVYNGPSTNADGSPYDMDSGLKDVVYQYNYSHNNPCGWMLYMGKNSNDIIRYNISDDGGDFIIKYFITPNSSPTYFVNNVIMYDGSRTKFMHRDQFQSRTYFYNNVFYNKSATTTTTWHDTAQYQGNLGDTVFSNNCFYEASGIHSQYEPRDANKVIMNPLMVDPGKNPQRGSDGILSGATIWDGYKLTEDSPLIDAGLYIPQMGTADFFGGQLYYGIAPDIGVHEFPRGEQNIPGGNLALDQAITSNNSHSAFAPEKAVDGDGNSRWASANSNLPIWLDIDFQQDTTFNKLVLTENIVPDWAEARIAKFDLQKKTGDTYETVYSYSGIVGQNKEFVFDPVTATKIRLNITQLRADTTTYGKGQTDPSLMEIEIYNILDQYPSQDENLALNKSVTASSSHLSCPVAKINDGVNSGASRWAAANSTLPAWVELDLGKATVFNKLVLTENIVADWAEARIAKFELQKKTGDTYETVYSYNGVVGQNKEFVFDPVIATKIRLNITQLRADTTTYGKGQTDPSLTEIEIYNIPDQYPSSDKNLALNKSVTASSSHLSCHVARINDGVNSSVSRWAAADSDLPAWVELDLGKTTAINKLVLSENIQQDWCTPRIAAIELQKWDGTAFQTIFTYEGVVGQDKSFSFAPITTDKVRLVITALRADTSANSAGQTDPSIRELELYNR